MLRCRLATLALGVRSRALTRPATRGLHAAASVARAANSERDGEPRLQRAAAPAAERPPAPFRERAPAAARGADVVVASSSTELKQQQDAAMDRATKKAGRIARVKRHRQGRRRMHQAGPTAPPPPLYFPAPFASLPVIPSPVETLQSALVRVDKVPKSPGFGKEIGRVRGQMAKYNFIARRQLEVATLELATKLQERIDAFPQVRRDAAPGDQSEGGEGGPCIEGSHIRRSKHEGEAELHPFDDSLLSCSLARGSSQYTATLNHAKNLVQRLKGAAADGLKGLNNSKTIWESRTVHKAAIHKMKALWASGVPADESNGFSGQLSGLTVVEEMRNVSKMLRHLPEIRFRRNLLDVRSDVASYLSLLPQEFFLLPEGDLTFARLRPYLPPSPDYTFTLFGGPNVGKSSLLSALSEAKVEVAPFAFTTKGLQMGHMDRREEDTPGWERLAPAKRKGKRATSDEPLPPLYTPAVPLTRVQLLDTPGLLFRPDSMRKPAELMALAVGRHVNPLLVGFVVDGTGQSGMQLRMQQYLRRELSQRFRFLQAPHPRASETDPTNRKDRDPLYANVNASAKLQSLLSQLQSIPWVDIRSKADVRKKEFVQESVLQRGEGQGEKSVREVEQEIEREAEKSAAAEQEEEESASPSSDETSLALSTPAASVPRPRVDRATWKLNEIRAHMRKYLCNAEGRIVLEDEDTHQQLQLAPTSTPAASAGASSSTSFGGSDWKLFTPRTPAVPTVSVSTETGAGLDVLAAQIWAEVDRRESLRVEHAYEEMKSRIIWMRQGGPQQPAEHTEIEASATTMQLTH